MGRWSLKERKCVGRVGVGRFWGRRIQEERGRKQKSLGKEIDRSDVVGGKREKQEEENLKERDSVDVERKGRRKIKKERSRRKKKKKKGDRDGQENMDEKREEKRSEREKVFGRQGKERGKLSIRRGGEIKREREHVNERK